MIKKKILIFDKGYALVEGNTEVEINNQPPIREMELDMEDAQYSRMASNPKRYKKEIETLVRKAKKQKIDKIKKVVKIEERSLTNEEIAIT